MTRRFRQVPVIAPALAAVLLFLTGCIVVSLNPFYEEKDVFFEPALLGNWQADKEKWRFEPAEHEAKAYLVTYSNDGKESIMTGHLFKIEEQWFLDLFGKTEGETMPPPIPSHMVAWVRVEEGKLILQFLDYENLGEWLKKNPKALRHQWRVNPGASPDDEYFVLTAETPDLKAFLRTHLKSTNLWNQPGTYERPDER